MLTAPRITVALTVAVMAGGCAFEAGHGFATITEATVHARFEPGPARNLDGGVLTDYGYTVQVDQLLLGLGKVYLEQLQVEGSAAFDPAAPPTDTSHCHGDHCHDEGDAAEGHEETHAEDGGDSFQVLPLAALPIDEEIDLLSGAPYTIEVRASEPSVELPRGSIDRVRIELTRLATTARFSGGRDDFAVDHETQLTVDLALHEHLAVTTRRPLDRTEPRELQLALDLTLDGTFFDGLDLAALAEQGLLTDTDPDTEPGSSLVQALLVTSLGASFPK